MRSARKILLGVLLATAPSIAGAQHVYKLNGSYADEYAGPSLVANGGTVSLGGYTFLEGQGLSLNGVLGTHDDYTIVMHFKFVDTDGYRRILEFKNGTSDCGYYNYFTIAYDYCVVPGTSAYAPNTWNTTIVTRNGLSHAFSAYVDGVLRASTPEDGDVGDFDTGIIRFFEDDYNAITGGENAAGRVDYIAIYGREFSAEEVATYRIDDEYLNEPDPAPAPEPSTVVLLATGLACVSAGAVRRRRSSK